MEVLLCPAIKMKLCDFTRSFMRTLMRLREEFQMLVHLLLGEIHKELNGVHMLLNFAV